MLHIFFPKIRNSNIILQERFSCALKIAYCELFPPHCTNSMAFRNISQLHDHFCCFFFNPLNQVTFLCGYCRDLFFTKKNPN